MLYTCNQKDTIGIKKVGGRKKTNKQTKKRKKKMEKQGSTSGISTRTCAFHFVCHPYMTAILRHAVGSLPY